MIFWKHLFFFLLHTSLQSPRLYKLPWYVYMTQTSTSMLNIVTFIFSNAITVSSFFDKWYTSLFPSIWFANVSTNNSGSNVQAEQGKKKLNSLFFPFFFSRKKTHNKFLTLDFELLLVYICIINNINLLLTSTKLINSR